MAKSRNHIPGIFNISHIFPPYREYHWFDNLERLNIDLNNQQFSDEKAWFFSELSTLIYDNEAFNRKTLTNKLKITDNDIHWFYSQGNEAILINYQQTQIVVFQGTHFPRLSFTNFASLTRTAENILVDDLVIAPIEQTVTNNNHSDSVKLHQGFVKALGKDDDHDSLWQQINRQLDKDKPLWLAGHSLGGAMATIAAMKNAQQVAGLYTYGTPCVGDSKAKQWQQRQLANKFFRYVNGSDIVCHIMTQPKFRRHFYHYEHAGELKSLNIQGNLGPFHLIEGLIDTVGLSFIDHSPIYYSIGCYEQL